MAATSPSRRAFLGGSLLLTAGAIVSDASRDAGPRRRTGRDAPGGAASGGPRGAAAQDVRAGGPRQLVPIWPEGVPDRRPDAGPERIENDRVHNVHDPTLAWYPPPAGTATRTGVVVCPGGGYALLAVNNEASGVTHFLTGIGVTAFVLKYRLREYGHPAPLRDVLRAIRLVRSRAAEFGLRADRIGVMGSSAGGHLAACAATLFDDPDGRTGAPLDAVPARPDFAVLQYPVITLDPPFAHAGSRRALVGAHPSDALVAKLSVHRQVTAATPPCFVMHTAEDAAVPIENSLLFYEALRRAGVSAEAHFYEKGPHGFGTREGLGTTSLWMGRWADWMRANGWLELG
jgi:acetyl esterase/lipase